MRYITYNNRLIYRYTLEFVSPDSIGCHDVIPEQIDEEEARELYNKAIILEKYYNKYYEREKKYMQAKHSIKDENDWVRCHNLKEDMAMSFVELVTQMKKLNVNEDGLLDARVHLAIEELYTLPYSEKTYNLTKELLYTL